MAAVGALLVSSGVALMAAPTPASADTECVPQDAYTETSGWLDTSPGPGWYQVDSRIKVPATEGHWVDLVWHNYTGNQPPPNEPPELGDPNWHALPADPQSAVHSVPPRVPNEPYNVSNENSGRGSWFLWTGTWAPASDAVYEYRFAFDHPAVTCGTEAYAEVQWIEPSCGTVAGYETSSGDPVDVTWSDPSATPGPGVTVTLTATAASGYAFGGHATKDFTHTFAEVVVPEGQTYDAVTGTCTTVSPPVTPPTTPPTTPQVSPPTADVESDVKAETTMPTVVEAGLAGGSTVVGASTGLALTLVGLVLLGAAAGLVVVEGSERS